MTPSQGFRDTFHGAQRTSEERLETRRNTSDDLDPEFRGAERLDVKMSEGRRHIWRTDTRNSVEIEPEARCEFAIQVRPRHGLRITDEERFAVDARRGERQ